jgi:hypothetical protein
MEMDLDRYATKGEARAARSLIHHALRIGYCVSVNDGEEWTVKASTDRNEILSALASTGWDLVRCAKGGGDDKVVAVFNLVWGNDPTGEELVADCTDNAAAEELCQLIYRN